MTNELYHHGILGMKWGVRRYQNEDGSLTPLGRKRLDKKDTRWAERHNVYKKAERRSEKEINKHIKTDYRPEYTANGKLTAEYINRLNNLMATTMASKVSDLRAPSGRVINFVAMRGRVGVYMAFADENYDFGSLKRGIWDSGRVAYKQDKLHMSGGNNE